MQLINVVIKLSFFNKQAREIKLESRTLISKTGDTRQKPDRQKGVSIESVPNYNLFFGLAQNQNERYKLLNELNTVNICHQQFIKRTIDGNVLSYFLFHLPQRNSSKFQLKSVYKFSLTILTWKHTDPLQLIKISLRI